MKQSLAGLFLNDSIDPYLTGPRISALCRINLRAPHSPPFLGQPLCALRTDGRQWRFLARAEHFNPTGLAGRFSVTPHHLNRVAQRRFGQSLSDWLREAQLNDAILLLRETKSVKETARRGGYRRVATLIEHFRHYHGLTPGQHLREIRRREKEIWAGRMPA